MRLESRARVGHAPGAPDARQAAGLTQLELAEKLGVTIGTIGYYERGAGMPKTDNLFALCDILHIRPADLLSADT